MAERRVRAAATKRTGLRDRLTAWAADDETEQALATTVLALADAAGRIAKLVAQGPLARIHAADTVGQNADGDIQKPLDVEANRLILTALEGSPVAYYASEEEDAILTLRAQAPLAVAVDPLDGSSNIDVNVSIGTIFSIFPVAHDGVTASFLRPALEQIAAGYFVYGPHTALVLTLGEGVDLYVLDPESGEFQLARTGLRIPTEAKEFAINASNYRHWSPAIRTFIDDCLEGAEGPRGTNFNMRWVASLVAETHRIFSRGGVFLYPGDRRPGYERGRLRFVYEAAPIAMLTEQAGGGATDGVERILVKSAGELHQRTPLIFGSSGSILSIAEYHTDPSFTRATPPLFQRRGLFRS
jgi:fructose-1,6-bisphosphatase I